MRLPPRASARQGFTLMELVLSTALLAVLMIAVFALIEGSMSMWQRSETRRDLTQQATGVVELLAQDFRSLEGGELGDLLIEWARFDTDGDEMKESAWPRIRLVRQASRAEIARMFPVEQQAPDPDQTGAATQAAGEEAPAEDLARPALIEVCWVLTPMSKKDADARSEGLFYRGVRRLIEGDGDSFFSDDFIQRSGLPRLAELDEVTGGLLWFQPLCATQTSIVHDGWSIGGDLKDASTSWDGWNHARPDTTVHAWNVPGAGMPGISDHALLPRRIRLELEFERPADRKRRTRTTGHIELTDTSFDVDDGERLPESGRYVKIEGEWMRVTGVSGRRVTVARGERGSEVVAHDSGALVHWGLNLVREVPVRLYREDWDL